MSILLKFLGGMDVATAIMILCFELGIIPFWFFVPFALDLIAKGVIFRTGAASTIDFGIALYILFMPLLGFWPISTVISIYLLQKGFVSFV